jgi:choice-of-anchor A domain-containing protein
MKHSYILFSLLALILAASPARAAYIDLGVAGEYNAFILGDYTNASDTQGRLAVGGNADLYNYSVGHYLPPGSTGNALVVGGDLNYQGGEVQNGDVTVGGNSSGAFTVRDGNLYANALLPFDFDAAATYLKNLSLSLGTIEANGGVVYEYGGMHLHGDGASSFQVFNVDGTDLLNANGLTIDQIADGATILINVVGNVSGLTNMSMNGLAPYNGNILFNFYGATDLTLSGIGVEGSILAPFADLINPQGQINGTLIAASFNGSMEQHYVPFDGGTPVPEPGTFLITGAGLLGLAGFMRRRGRRANA